MNSPIQHHPSRPDEPSGAHANQQQPLQIPLEPLPNSSTTVIPNPAAHTAGTHTQAYPWLTYNRLVAGGVIALVLLGIAGLFLRPPSQQHTAVTETHTANKQALLLSVQGETEDALFNARIQLQTYREDLLKVEARRMQVKAEALIRNAESACFRQALDCAYEALLLDTKGHLIRAQQIPDDAATRLALDSIAAIEYARADVAPVAPEHALSQLAVQQMIDAIQQQRNASAEAKAAELLQEGAG